MADNNTCSSDQRAPSSSQFFNSIDSTSLTLVAVSAALTITIYLLFIMQSFVIREYVSSIDRRSYLTWIVGLAPVAATCSLIAICVPRAASLCDIVIYLYIARTLFVTLNLVFDFFGGRTAMIVSMRDRFINLASRPVCCCCVCLPHVDASKKHLRYLELMVFQAALIRPICDFSLAVVYANNDYKPLARPMDRSAALVNAISTVTAMYALYLFQQISKETLSAFKIPTTFRFVQLILVLFNLQSVVFSFLATTQFLVCTKTLPAFVQGQLWNHTLLIFEIVLLNILVCIFLRPTVNAAFDKLHGIRAIKTSTSSY